MSNVHFQPDIIGISFEENFFVQIFVVVLLAVGYWVYTLVKKKPDKFGSRQFENEKTTYNLRHTFPNQYKPPGRSHENHQSYRFNFADAARSKDPGKIKPGMELLEPDFLLCVIENTKGSNKNEVEMRILCFNEILRRNQPHSIKSDALKVYAVNKKNLYTKNIQCQAMKELAKRTAVPV
ncbi:MAG: hypothetical protein ACYTBP_14300 [Planctomycetota bacterium]|jgi:hypothetical protein